MSDTVIIPQYVMETTVTELHGRQTVETSGRRHDTLGETHNENSQARVLETGPGAELVRQLYVNQLRGYMEAFYEHGNLADVVALSRALELSEQVGADHAPRQASVVESFLGMLGVEPLQVLNSLSRTSEEQI